MLDGPVSVLWACVECFHFKVVIRASSLHIYCLAVEHVFNDQRFQRDHIKWGDVLEGGGEGWPKPRKCFVSNQTHKERKKKRKNHMSRAWFWFSKAVMMDSSVHVCSFPKLSVWLKDQQLQFGSQYWPHHSTVWLPGLCWLSRRSLRTLHQHLDHDRSQERPHHGHHTTLRALSRSPWARRRSPKKLRSVPAMSWRPIQGCTLPSLACSWDRLPHLPHHSARGKKRIIIIIIWSKQACFDQRWKSYIYSKLTRVKHQLLSASRRHFQQFSWITFKTSDVDV